jgi:hypothetical protein
VFGSCVLDVEDGLLLGRLNSDHMLEGDVAPSENASSLFVIAPVIASNGFCSSANALRVNEGSTS